MLWSCSASIDNFDGCKEVLTVSWLWLNEINPWIKWILELAKGHLENCDHPNFPSTSLGPTVAWTALLPEPCHQLSLGLMPQAPLSPLQRGKRAGMAWRLPGLLPAMFLQGSRWAGHVAGSPTLPLGPWAFPSLTPGPLGGPAIGMWWPCGISTACGPGAMAWPCGISNWRQNKLGRLRISALKGEGLK